MSPVLAETCTYLHALEAGIGWDLQKMCFKEDHAAPPPDTAQPTTGTSGNFLRIDAKVLRQIDAHIRSDFFWAFLYLGTPPFYVIVMFDLGLRVLGARGIPIVSASQHRSIQIGRYL